MNNFGRGLPKDHLCENIQKLDQRFRRGCRLSQKLTDGQPTKNSSCHFVTGELNHEISKPVTDLRGMYLIHDNAAAHKCKLVKDFPETETVVQLPNPLNPPNVSPCDFSCFLY